VKSCSYVHHGVWDTVSDTECVECVFIFINVQPLKEVNKRYFTDVCMTYISTVVNIRKNVSLDGHFFHHSFVNILEGRVKLHLELDSSCKKKFGLIESIFFK